MITEQDIQRVTSEQEVYENTLESMVNRLERENRSLKRLVRDLERKLSNIRMETNGGK